MYERVKMKPCKERKNNCEKRNELYRLKIVLSQIKCDRELKEIYERRLVR